MARILVFIISQAYDEGTEGERTAECLKDIIYVSLCVCVCAYTMCREKSPGVNRVSVNMLLPFSSRS